MIRKYCSHFLIAVLAILLLCGLAHASDSDFQQGIKALGSNDFATALRYLEAAVTDDPDNVRYASEYRKAAIKNKDFDRSLKFFEKLTSDHPNSANLHLNFGFAYVDKIPVAGSITQVILANNALAQFSKAVELKPNWINLYTRGVSYLFWPKVFNRAPNGVADLEQALSVQKREQRQSYHAKTYIALGDAYWKTDQLDKARAIWQEGLKLFPDRPELKTRLAQQGDDLKNTIEANFDPNKRVDTDLRDLWASSQK
jgi:tetratricopeptide (TPR) repeat protein